MPRLISWIAVGLATLLLGGCWIKQGNPNSCDLAANQSEPQCSDAPPPSCEDNDDCVGADAKVCKKPGNICVQCTPDDAAACVDNTPICDGDDNRCIGCRAHGDCPGSNACTPEGACAPENKVAYVKADGTGTSGASCVQAAPCPTLADALAVPGIDFVKVISGGGDVTDDAATTFDNRDVTIVADPTASVTRSSNGVILKLTGTSRVRIVDLHITTAKGAQAEATGIDADGGTTLTLLRVKVTACIGVGVVSDGSTIIDQAVIATNFGGGAILGNRFTVTNSLFVANGSGSSTTGGLSLSPTEASVFEFNTVADNASSGATVASRGINCTVPFAVTKNIIVNNATPANCSHTFTLFEAGATVNGSNLAGDPAFLNTIPTDPFATDFYRIGAASMAKDKVDAGADILDIDGDPRPTTPGLADIGADEAR